MYSIYLLLFILSVQIDGLWIYKKSVLCIYNFKQKYPEIKSDHNTTVGFFNSSHIYYCPREEVPIDNISYVIDDDKDRAENFFDLLHVEFPPPKRECMYGIALLVNPLIQNKEECSKYEFDPHDNTKIHGIERNMCVFKHDNPFVKNEDDSIKLYEDRVRISFPYIFTGCYALRFHINHKQKYIASNSKFFNTTYQRTEAAIPQLICRYNSRLYPEAWYMTNFTLDISVTPDTFESLLQVALISQQNRDSRKGCLWQGEPFLFVWIIDLEVNNVSKELTDQHCTIKFVESVKGKYKKSVTCNFQIEAPAARSCFVYNLLDQRCKKNTIWKPPSDTDKTPCLWVSHCRQNFEHWRHVDTAKSKTLEQDTLLSASSYLLLPIIAIVLIVSAVIGILCFRRYLRIRKEEINLYVNPQHDDSNCLKSTDSDIIDNSEKEIDHSNPSCNIVLLYTNSSTSFMTLMKDFRKTLAKMCSCFVHDWHDGAVWNEVAKIGAVSWFTELLNNGCRIVWIDTPITRSVIISNSRDNESSSDKLSKYYEIHDFRDMAFRSVLEVAKSKVNDVTRQYRRHFVVRFEGLESTANVDDPFLDLSPHSRYYMPQHLMQLCSDLSVVKPEISKCKTKIDEDVYRIFVYQLYKCQTQQRLKCIKMDTSM